MQNPVVSLVELFLTIFTAVSFICRLTVLVVYPLRLEDIEVW